MLGNHPCLLYDRDFVNKRLLLFEFSLFCVIFMINEKRNKNYLERCELTPLKIVVLAKGMMPLEEWVV